MSAKTLVRGCAVGAAAAAVLLLQSGIAEAAGYCSYVESTYSVKFTCHPTTTSFSVCVASAEFAAYRGTPVTKRTNSFGGSATLSDGSLYLVRGSETCSAS